MKGKTPYRELVESSLKGIVDKLIIKTECQWTYEIKENESSDNRGIVSYTVDIDLINLDSLEKYSIYRNARVMTYVDKKLAYYNHPEIRVWRNIALDMIEFSVIKMMEEISI